jgi:hypothetical protein
MWRLTRVADMWLIFYGLTETEAIIKLCLLPFGPSQLNYFTLPFKCRSHAIGFFRQSSNPKSNKILT